MSKATGPLYKIHFKRRREYRTDYRKRIALLKSRLSRMVVRKTNRFVLVQFINFADKGDATIAAFTSKQLNKLGFQGKCNTPSAYLTGALAAKKALEKGVKEFVPDFGLHTTSKASLLFAAVKGAVDAGMQASVGEGMLPSQERISGMHLSEETRKQFEEVRKKIFGQ